jgi:hypothetical protein
MKYSSYIKKRASIFDKTIEFLEDKVNSTKICNKIKVPVPILFHILDKIDDLKKIKLPENCVIKFNNLACSKGIVIRKENQFVKYKNIHEVIQYLHKNKTQNPHCQISIRNIAQKVIIEELLFPEEHVLYDIKCYTFYGKVRFIHIINPEKRNDTYMFDETGKRVYIFERDLQNKTSELKKPKHYDNIVKYANKLAQEYCKKYALRIDFYSTTRGAMFGEFTFNPCAGNGLSEKGDELMGSFLKI